MITVYTVAYNESLLIQFMIDHYRLRFPGCKIVVYDNESDDGTSDIARSNGCEVITYSTNNQISDSKYLEIKDNCWKNAETEWVLVCDVDELLDITEAQLKEEEAKGNTIIKSEGYNMVNMNDNLDLKSIDSGARADSYDKSYLFNKKYIQEIKYVHGCHRCNPIGYIQISETAYKAYHYKYINLDLLIQRYRTYHLRLSQENLENRWGWHYTQSTDQVKDDWNKWATLAEKIIQ